MRREQKERGREGGRWPKRKRTKTRRGSRGGLFSEDIREPRLARKERIELSFISAIFGDWKDSFEAIVRREEREIREEIFPFSFNREGISRSKGRTRIEERNGTFREEIIAS